MCWMFKNWAALGLGVCLCACLGMTAVPAWSDTLVQYNFPATSSWDSSDTDPNSVASTFTFSGMGTSGSSHGRSSATTGPHLNTIYTRGSVLTTTDADALAGADYYSFTLTPGSGYNANLTSLTFLADATQGGGTISYTANFFVRSSLDAYSSNLGTFSDGPSSSANASFNLHTVDLTAPAFQNLDAAVTFRIYLYHTGTDALSTNAITRSDTYTLNGTMVAVPEPTTILLMGLAVSTLWGLRRFQASKS